MPCRSIPARHHRGSGSASNALLRLTQAIQGERLKRLSSEADQPASEYAALEYGPNLTDSFTTPRTTDRKFIQLHRRRLDLAATRCRCLDLA